MKPFLLVATLVALVSARPEAGYNYPRPGGGAIGGIGGINGGHGGNFGGISGGTFGGNFGGHSSGFESSFSGGSGSFGGASHGGSFGGGSHGGSFGGSSHGSSFGGSSGSFGGSSGSFAGSSGSSGSFGGSSFGGHSGGVTVQKHIYVHVPPPEPEEFHHQKHIAVGQAQKHYKIIFIKAPTQATPTAPSIPLQAQNEEKTLVYVLVKKPDEQPDITIPTAAPTQPSKPEVYFIRYKTQKEHGGHSGAIGGGSIGGGSIGGGGGSIGGITTGHGSESHSHHHHTEVIGGGDAGHHLSGNTGSSSVSTNYGPPGQSGPY